MMENKEEEKKFTICSTGVEIDEKCSSYKDSG